MNFNSCWRYPKRVEDELSKVLPLLRHTAEESEHTIGLPRPEPSSRWEGEATIETARKIRDVLIYALGGGKF